MLLTMGLQVNRGTTCYLHWDCGNKGVYEVLFALGLWAKRDV